MRTMIVVSNRNFVTFYETDQKDDAINARKDDPRLKYARITEALQARPSEVEIGKVYQR